MLVYYILSGGCHPFYDDVPYSYKRNICMEKYSLTEVKDRAAQDLIEWMLCPIPDCRPTIDECLGHAYLAP